MPDNKSKINPIGPVRTVRKVVKRSIYTLVLPPAPKIVSNWGR